MLYINFINCKIIVDYLFRNKIRIWFVLINCLDKCYIDDDDNLIY